MTLSMNWKIVRQVLLKDLGKIKIFAQFVPHYVAGKFFLHGKEALRKSEHCEELATLFTRPRAK